MIRKSQVYLAVIIAAGLAITGITLLNMNQGILNYSNDVTPLSVGNQAEGIQSSAPETHEFTMVMKETTVEIAPGIRVLAWAYNGTIPGPTIRVTEGDRVIVHFINNSTTTHTIHFHGDHDALNDGVFEEVLPNEIFTYDFIAEPAGALMYHCHIMPVTLHIRNGMYGAFIVDPKEPLEPAREYVLVMGEYDTRDQMTEIPQYIMLNGYIDQYFSNPLPVRVNETVRIYFINVSASPSWGFHIHGTTFKAWTSGMWENPPVKALTFDVSAGDTAIFEAKWPWDGRFLFHIHGTPEEKGTMGYFNITRAPEFAIDGVDVAITKSVSMIDWQEDLIKENQKEDPNEKMSPSTPTHDSSTDMEKDVVETTSVSLPLDSAKPSLQKTFSPENIRVNVGDMVTWTNDDSAIHTVTSKEEGIFDSAIMKPGDIFTYTFETAGTFDYVCTLHPWMTATVIVTQMGGEVMENVYNKEPDSKGGKGFFESREANEVYVGWGSPTIQRIAFFPKNIEVKVGESVNFVSKVGKVAEPHTVTFIMDRNYSLPEGTNLAAYTIPRSMQLMPSLTDFNSEAMVIPGEGEVDTLVALNARSWSPVVIDSKDKVNYLGPNKKYVLNGSEKYVNSGWLFPEEFTPPSSGGTTFTVTFEKEGQYPYYCVVHPWMEGKVTVK